MEPSGNKPGFFTRLKQHHIYRVVVVYAVACWVLIQLANSLFPDFGVSRQAVRILIIVLLLGFPLVLILSWMLIKPKDPVQYTAWQRLHWKLGAGLSVVAAIVVVVSGFYAWRFSAHLDAVQTAGQQVTPAFNPPSDSLVVLPFTNLNGNPQQQYFSDGITQELTEALGKNPALRVIAWDTASTFRDPKRTAVDIGKQLNVSNLLYGSILRQGERVRISVELVNTVTGYLLWSAHYDEPFKNIFVVQDEVSKAIAGTLQVKFAALQGTPTQNPEAHDLYLKGIAALDRLTATDTQAAQEDFQQALKLDPNYADAWAGLARTWLVLSQVSTLPLKKALPKIRMAAEKALALDPHNVNALVQLANADANDNRIAEAKQEIEQALALDPSNEPAHLDYAIGLPLELGLAETQEAARLDPDDATVQNNLAVIYQDLADWPQMVAASLAMIKLSPHNIDAAFYLAFAYVQMQRGEDAAKAFELVQPANALDRQLADAGRLTYRSLLQHDLRPKALAALGQLRRAHISPGSQSDLLQLYLALGEKETALRMLPGNCAATPIGCNDLTINPMYTPLHGDPRFEKLAKQYTSITRDPAPVSAASS